jgi:transaldolase
MTTRLHQLYEQGGQSPWVDNLRRSWLHDGHLGELLANGVRGLTSNPTIFAQAIERTSDYDEEFARLAVDRSVEDAYWAMAIEDIQAAADLFGPLYEASGGGDGFVSLEVSPTLAHDTAGTLAAARDLWERVDRPNLLVKIPATLEGLGAIEEAIAAGISVNVTLIFSLERYRAVIAAYQSGLERLAATRPERLGQVHSVASFFVSRVDTAVDRRLDALASAEALALRGKAALAQARLAYEAFGASLASERWAELAALGARPERPLWASTSTKNPAYPDLLYVEGLIGPGTVNTMPDQTLDAFLDHGRIDRTVDADFDADREVLDRLAELGIDLDEVDDELEAEGVASFAKSFSELLEQLSDKARMLGVSGGAH